MKQQLPEYHTSVSQQKQLSKLFSRRNTVLLKKEMVYASFLKNWKRFHFGGIISFINK